MAHQGFEPRLIHGANHPRDAARQVSPERRAFLRATAASALAGGLGKARSGEMAYAQETPGNSRSANEQIVLGLIGCGGQGSGLARAFAPHARWKYLCDPDPRQAGQTAERLKSSDVKAGQHVTDLRRVLDDPDVDAVVIATPDHWHAPAAIMACAAGKHVYVEKPCCHNFREGQLLVAAARRHRRVVQHGTQSRSNPLIASAVQMLREGVIGDVLVAKAWNIQRRANIGRQSPTKVPAGVDYDLWVGPAEMLPFQENRFHYNWRWWHNFGTGDIGNDGTHEIDYARWGLGVEGLPTTAIASGGKYHHDDDQQFPDTATCVFEYPGDCAVGHRRQLIFEMRLWSTNYPYQVDSGAEFYGTQGRLFVSKRGKLEVYGERNERVPEPRPEQPLGLVQDNHQLDFLDAIRHDRRPQADIETGFHSVALVHLANLALRQGKSLQLEPERGTLVGDDSAATTLGRNYRDGGHWAVPAG